MAPPPTAEELQQREAELQRAEDGAEGGALAQRAQLPPPKPRSLASEITMSRQHGTTGVCVTLLTSGRKVVQLTQDALLHPHRAISASEAYKCFEDIPCWGHPKSHR